MKRKFLAKAITLGLMLAVPFGVEAAEIIANTTIDKDTTYNESMSIKSGFTVSGTSGKENIEVKGAFYVNGELNNINLIKVSDGNFHNNGTIEANVVEGSVNSKQFIRNYATMIVGEKIISTQQGFENSESGILKFKNNAGIIEGSLSNHGMIQNSDGKVLDKLTITGTMGNYKDLYIKNLNVNGIGDTALSIGDKNTENTVSTVTLETDILTCNSYVRIYQNGTLKINDKVTATSGQIENDGKLAFSKDTGVIEGTLSNRGGANIVKIDDAGTESKLDKLSISKDLSNNGDLNISNLEVGNLLTNSKTGSITASSITSDSYMRNSGIMKTNTIVVTNSSASFENYNTVKFTGDNGTGTIEGNYNHREGAQLVDNNDQEKVNLTVTGNLDNGISYDNYKGTKLTLGSLTVGGTLNNYNETTVTNDMDINNLVNNSTGVLSGETITVSNGENSGTLKISDSLDVKKNGEFIFDGNNENGNISKVKLDDSNVSLTEKATDLNVGEVVGSGNVKISDLDSKLNVGNNNANLTIIANSNVTDSFGNDINGGMKKLLDTVQVVSGNKETNAVAAAGSVTGEVTASRDAAGNYSGAKEEINKDNAGISEMASIGLMAWRAENNDMNKRLGELRSSKGEHGVWTRMVRGQSKYGAQNVKNQYSTYQLGYDEKLSVDKHWTVGAAVSYTDASSSFTTGHGENKSTGLAVYGSYLGDNGSFVDLIAKVARLKNEFDVLGGAGKGDYETNGYSISAEYGKRFTKDNGFWIEPQVELTYGYVGAVDYLTSNDVSVRQNGMDSLVGRVGFSLGRDIKAGNVYARASYLYDFDGETDVTFSKGVAVRGFKQDLGGSWWEVGVGTNINLSDATHLYFDVEKTYGGNVATPWQWNAGVRWSF